MQQPVKHHGRSERSESAGAVRPAANFITWYPKEGLSREVEEPRHRVLFSEATKVREALRQCQAETQSESVDGSLQSYVDEIARTEDRRLELYMRSRWSTVLFVVKEVLKDRTAEESKRELRLRFRMALKRRIMEKIVFETLNPSLAKIVRSETPPGDFGHHKSGDSHEKAAAGEKFTKPAKTQRRGSFSAKDTSGPVRLVDENPKYAPEADR